MSLSVVKTLGLLVLAVVGIATRADAGIITVPPGLSPGDQYRLVFVTSGTTNATSSDISTYNTFVTDAADAVPALDALGATWKVIGSTATVNAIDNIMQDPGIPIYSLEGQKVADDATTNTNGLFGGSLLTPILYNEHGEINNDSEVFTGTSADGTAVSGLALGSLFVERGASDAGTSAWVQNGTKTRTAEHPLYAISSEITAVPEPSTIGLVILGGASLLFLMRRKQRSRLANRTNR